MRIWLGARRPPVLCGWLQAEFEVPAIPIRDLGFLGAGDEEFFRSARANADVVMTKDRDFADSSCACPAGRG